MVILMGMATTVVIVSVVPVIPRSVPVVIPMAVPRIIPVIVTTVAVILRVAFPVVGRVLTLIPVVADEIDALAASVVPMAVLAPVFHVARGHVQIDRSPIMVGRIDHDGPGRDENRHGIVPADVYPTVEARLANADRNAHIGGEGRRNEQGGSEDQSFHSILQTRKIRAPQRIPGTDDTVEA